MGSLSKAGQNWPYTRTNFNQKRRREDKLRSYLSTWLPEEGAKSLRTPF